MSQSALETGEGFEPQIYEDVPVHWVSFPYEPVFINQGVSQKEEIWIRPNMKGLWSTHRIRAGELGHKANYNEEQAMGYSSKRKEGLQLFKP